MVKNRTGLVAILLWGMSIHAWAQSGSWNESGYGGQTQFGMQVFTSQQLKAPLTLGIQKERVFSISWRIESSLPTEKMTVRLCASVKCIKLPAVSGNMVWPDTSPPLAASAFVFVYQINKTGHLPRLFIVRRNTLTVNYH